MRNFLLCILCAFDLCAQTNKKTKFPHSTFQPLISASAASNVYSFSTFTANYEEIGGNLLSAGLKWDDPFYLVPLDFDFEIYQSGNDTVNLVNASFVTFTSSNNPLVTLASPMFEDICDKAFMPATDQEGDPGGLSSVSYTVTGQVGDRVCIIQVKNAGFFEENAANGVSASTINFQIWLYENGHNIEFRYGLVDIKNPSINLINPAGFLCGLAENLNLNTLASSSSDVLSGTHNNPVKSNLSSISQVITGPIQSGRVYKFTKVHPNPLGLQDMSFPGSPFFYPNPATNVLHLAKELENSGAMIDILDVTGKLILSAAPNDAGIDLTRLQRGVYLVRISSDPAFASKLVLID